jgi:hypothetical protein
MSAATKKSSKRVFNKKSVEESSPVPSKKQKTDEIVYGMGSLQKEEDYNEEDGHSESSSSGCSKELSHEISVPETNVAQV